MTESYWHDMFLLGLLWLGYFALHSVLASLKLKNWFARLFPERMPFYRLGFNGLAVLTLLPILWLIFHYHGPTLWAWRGVGAWLSNGLALAALCGFMASLKHYDPQEFLGLSQWKAHSKRVQDQEGFHLSPFHRYVRHPWYFFGLVLIWTRDMNAAMFLSAVLATLYFVIGSWLEERKLVVYHGDIYRRYMKRVPGLIPLPWKAITVKEAAELVNAAEKAEA